MGNFKKYNYVVNCANGHKFEGSDFYIYPVTVNDYADLYRNYSYDKYPVMAFIYLTNKCADNCNGCFARSIEDGNAELSLPVIEKLLSDLAVHGTKAIKLAGREPTSSPYLSRCIELSDELGMKSIVISSGAGLDKHEKALSEHCSHLRLSLNTINQALHESIHHPTNNALKFDERIKFARRIIEKRKERNLVTGATYLVRSQDDVIGYEYTKMCKDMGFDYVRFTVLDDYKGNWDSKWEEIYLKLLTLEDDGFKVNIHNPIKGEEIEVHDHNVIDPAIVSRVVIHANGKVNCCQEGWRGKWDEPGIATFGNINDDSFYNIWTGERRKRFLGYIKETHEKGMEQCGVCISGNQVCANNCKYKSFNILQKWIIKELESDSNSNFKPVLLEAAWN